MDEGKKIDISWLKIVAVCVSVIGAANYERGASKGTLDAHIHNVEIHKTQAELSAMYVLRREYESNTNALREDMRWVKSEMIRISDKIDRLVERNAT